MEANAKASCTNHSALNRIIDINSAEAKYHKQTIKIGSERITLYSHDIVDNNSEFSYWGVSFIGYFTFQGKKYDVRYGCGQAQGTAFHWGKVYLRGKCVGRFNTEGDFDGETDSPEIGKMTINGKRYRLVFF